MTTSLQRGDESDSGYRTVAGCGRGGVDAPEPPEFCQERTGDQRCQSPQPQGQQDGVDEFHGRGFGEGNATFQADGEEEVMESP